MIFGKERMLWVRADRGVNRPGRSRNFRNRSAGRIALDALTPKCAATWRHDIPPPIADNTRRRRSIESAMAIPAASRSGRQLESESTRFGNPWRFGQARMGARAEVRGLSEDSYACGLATLYDRVTGSSSTASLFFGEFTFVLIGQHWRISSAGG